MKRKLYLDIALLVVVLGVFVFMQRASATDTLTQEADNVSTTGCCGSASKVEGETSSETADGCCATPAPETAQSEIVSQQSQSQDTSKTVPQTPQNEDADSGGCDLVEHLNIALSAYEYFCSHKHSMFLC